jgi:hypothetical protein
MPTGRPLLYEHFDFADLQEPLRLVPPEEAYRVYLHSETGFIRYLHADGDGRELTKNNGFPLLPSYSDEFDVDLHNLWVIAGMQDSALSVYWYGT